LSFLEKLEVEMMHCDGWPSKGNPLKQRRLHSEDINKGGNGKLWKIVVEMRA